MLPALGQLLPFAVAGALSSVPIVAVLTLLLGGHGRAPAVVFGIGYVAGVFATSSLAAVVLRSTVVRSDPVAASPGVGVVEIVLGVACVVVAVLPAHVTRRRSHGTAVVARAFRALPPALSSVVGVAVALRPKSLLLASGVGIVLSSAQLALPQDVVLLAVNAVVTGSTVAAPIGLALGDAERGRDRLESTRAWIARNARSVTVVVLLLVGTVLVGDGLGRF